MDNIKITLRNINEPDSHKLDTYLRLGGYKGLTQVLNDMIPEEVIGSIKRSGLRGRGGAAFPAGLKWEFARRDRNFPKYIVCNADEGEPGTFKDRAIIEKDPFAIIEGMTIAGFSIGAEKGYIYIRGEYVKGARILKDAIKEAKESNFLGSNIQGKDFNFDIDVYVGAGSYICGEETALLESLEGKVGHSRIKPPFPINVGLWGKPTVLNNVETFALISPIIVNGDEWFANTGSRDFPGTMIYSLSGHVHKPGLYELPTGTHLADLIYKFGGGIKDGKKLKAVFPGGLSSGCLNESEIDISMDHKGLAKVGSMLGSGAVIVINDETCMVEIARRANKFFRHESCGKCVPCREGTFWISKILLRIVQGEGKKEDLDLIMDLGQGMKTAAFCGLGLAAANPILSIIKRFPKDFESHIKDKKCAYKTGQINNRV
ncbi:MAG: NADH-quinone oxidoreductase subunit NuoF [bacterium]